MVSKIELNSMLVLQRKNILELIHSDVFGPIPIESLRGSLYYASFIDYFARNSWLYFLKNK